MNRSRLSLSPFSCPLLLFILIVLLTALLVPAGWAQKGEGYNDMATPQVRSNKLASPEHLRTYVVDGKLTLSLRDAVVLTLENNSFVRIQETQVDFSKFALLGAHSPFDPSVTGSYITNNSTFPPQTTLGGTGLELAAKSITRSTQLTYSQTFETGTNVQAGLSSSHYSFNNSSLTSTGIFDPSINSTLNFQFTQPLLKNGWLFANQAPLVIARRNLQQSRANFAAQVSNNILQAVGQYWSVVEAQGNLEVARSSMDAAEATYKRDKRALELGALPPLDIYRSESQVASRRVQVIRKRIRAQASRGCAPHDHRRRSGSEYSGPRSGTRRRSPIQQASCAPSTRPPRCNRRSPNDRSWMPTAPPSPTTQPASVSLTITCCLNSI